MTSDARKACIRRLYDEVWNQGNLTIADELFAGDYASPLPGAPPGPEGEKRHVAMLRATFPTLRITVDELVAEGDTVAARWTMVATDTGGFMGRAPTGKCATFWGVHFFRFAGDRIAACWVGVDMLGLMVQLGVVPSPWQPEAPGIDAR